MSATHEHTTTTSTPDPTVTTVTVTPAMATRWLETNDINRHVRQSRVEQYARDMTAGHWSPTVEPIKFPTTGTLLDGQHRLWAIVESGATVDLFVASGLDETTQHYMDSGIARTAADDLGMRGETNSPLLSSIARLGCVTDRDLLFRDRKRHVRVDREELAQEPSRVRVFCLRIQCQRGHQRSHQYRGRTCRRGDTAYAVERP
jgi:hypothetical protein